MNKSFQDWIDLLCVPLTMLIIFAVWKLIPAFGGPEIADAAFSGIGAVILGVLALALLGGAGWTTFRAMKRLEMCGLSE